MMTHQSSPKTKAQRLSETFLAVSRDISLMEKDCRNDQSGTPYAPQEAQAMLTVAWVFFGVGRLIQKLESNGLLDIDD